MEDKKLGAVESRFADLIWDNAPINSTALVRLCAKELDWKKSTTYTVLKKLCDRGIFQNIDGTVTALVSREEYTAAPFATLNSGLLVMTGEKPKKLFSRSLIHSILHMSPLRTTASTRKASPLASK